MPSSTCTILHQKVKFRIISSINFRAYSHWTNTGFHSLIGYLYNRLPQPSPQRPVQPFKNVNFEY